MAGVVGLDGEGLGPEIRGKVLISLTKGVVGGLQEVFSSSGMTGGLSVAILNTSKGDHLLGDGSTDDTGTTRSRHKLDKNGSALARDLAWHGMDVTDLVTPITATDGDETKLSIDKGTLDGNLDFLGDLDTKTDVASHVTDGDDSLEAGALTGLGLFLNGDDLHDIILKLVLRAFDELVNNLSLLDGDGVSVDLLESLDVTGLDETAELGLGEPFVLGGTTAATWATTATAASAAEATTAITAISTTISTTISTAISTHSSLTSHAASH